MTCTFKNDTAPTGLMKVGWTMGCTIKFKKKVCGNIYSPNHWNKENYYTISLQVKNEDTWKRITLKARFDSLNEAKEFCKEHWTSIMQKYDLYFMED